MNSINNRNAHCSYRYALLHFDAASWRNKLGWW